jgi:hypothetical protein
MTLYSGWRLTDRTAMLQRLLTVRPMTIAFPVVVCDHVTLVFPATVAPRPARIEVVGVATGQSVQALIVTVDGQTTRPDGRTFHITLSREPGVKDVTSNEMLRHVVPDPIDPFLIEAVPFLTQS